MTRITSIRSAGFTLVELVTTIVLISILSTAVIINIDVRAKHSVTIQADELRRNLSHLQLLAISQSQRLWLKVTSTSYSVCAISAATCNSANAIHDTATHHLNTGDTDLFSEDMQDGVTFTAGTGDYYFDSLGRPVSANTGATLKSDTSTFTLTGTGRSVSVTVLPITGFAKTAY